jgi:hypothetical protein
MISELDSNHTPLHRGDHDYKEFGKTKLFNGPESLC